MTSAVTSALAGGVRTPGAYPQSATEPIAPACARPRAQSVRHAMRSPKTPCPSYWCQGNRAQARQPRRDSWVWSLLKLAFFPLMDLCQGGALRREPENSTTEATGPSAAASDSDVPRASPAAPRRPSLRPRACRPLAPRLMRPGARLPENASACDASLRATLAQGHVLSQATHPVRSLGLQPPSNSCAVDLARGYIKGLSAISNAGYSALECRGEEGYCLLQYGVPR